MSLAASNHLPIYIVGCNYAFVCGNLEEEAYMENPPRFAAKRSIGVKCAYSIAFFRHSASGCIFVGRLC